MEAKRQREAGPAEETPAPGARKYKQAKAEGLERLRAERVPFLPQRLENVEVTRTGTYAEMFALLQMAMLGELAMCVEVADPVLFARGVDAVRKLRDSLVKAAGAGDSDGMPWSPFG